jgi:regulator of protease activity HflC (stomatin/prohibitin superfamily)
MNIFYDEKNENVKMANIIIAIIVFALIIVATIMYVSPIYSVWASKKAGEAKLAKAKYAEYTARVKAKAKKEAAIYLAQAEVERARGIAKSIKIVGDALNQNPGYLNYRWLQVMKTTKNQVIYVPEQKNSPMGLFINATKK